MVRKKRFKRDAYELRMQEHLYTITYRFLGQPAPGNRWLYPDIMLWDEDRNGNNLIPAFVIFYFNPTYRYPYEKRWALERQLADHIPDKWDCYWFFGEGYIFAERRDDELGSALPESVRNMNRHAAHQYDVFLAAQGEDFSGNGHKEILEDENVVFVVPQPEPD